MGKHRFYEHDDRERTLKDGMIEKTFGCLCGEIGDEDFVAERIEDECWYYTQEE